MELGKPHTSFNPLTLQYQNIGISLKSTFSVYFLRFKLEVVSTSRQVTLTGYFSLFSNMSDYVAFQGELRA